MLNSLFLAIAFALVHSGPQPAVQAKPALDDATIVAIFDAANTFDIETGTLGSTKPPAPSSIGRSWTTKSPTTRQ